MVKDLIHAKLIKKTGRYGGEGTFIAWGRQEEKPRCPPSDDCELTESECFAIRLAGILPRVGARIARDRVSLR